MKQRSPEEQPRDSPAFLGLMHITSYMMYKPCLTGIKKAEVKKPRLTKTKKAVDSPLLRSATA
jgi:hypothetical protein